MGKGKSKTVNDLVSIHLFNQDENLFSKELIRLYALNKELSAFYISNTMVTTSSKYFSSTLLTKLESTCENIVTIQTIREDDILNHIISNIDAECSTIVDFTADADTTDFKLYDYIKRNYMTISDCQRNFQYQILNSDFTITTDIIELNGEKYLISQENTSFKKQLLSTNLLWRVYLDKSSNMTNCEFDNIEFDYIDCPKDDRIVYSVVYRTSSGEVKTVFIFKEDIEPITTEDKFLIIPLKEDFNLVNDNKYRKAVFNLYGLNNGDLENSLKESSIKDAFITISTWYKNPEFKDIIERIYGTEQNPNVVKITTNYPIVFEFVEWQGQIVLRITYRGVHREYIDWKDNGDNLFMLLPLDYFKKIPFQKRYKYLKECFNCYVLTSQTVKYKWYQTGFFQKLILIISVATFAFTAYTTIVSFSSMIQHGVKDAFSKFITATLSKTTELSASNILAIANKASEIYFKNKIDSLNDEMLEFINNTEKLRKEIEKYQNKAIYIPFDNIDNYYDTIFETLYDMERFYEQREIETDYSY